MNRTLRPALALLALLGAVVLAPTVSAQDAPDDAPLPPPPPEVQKLIDLARDPDRLRSAMSDPAKVQELMSTMENEVVREFMSDPRRVQQLMREIDPQAVFEVLRSVDFSTIRAAAWARWVARLKAQLGVTDEEWKALEPKIETVIRAQRDARVGPGGGRFGRGPGPGFGFGAGIAGGGPPAPPALVAGPSPLQQAAADLREAAADPEASTAEIRQLLTAYRKARDKAREKLDAAERDLKDLLTQRQEGILVMAGVLN